MGAVLSGLKSIPAFIYDALILHMTELWYHSVLDRIEKGSDIIDVGIGTAGALLRCKKVLEEKNIYVAGVDYNSFYVNSAEKAIKDNKLESLIQVECKSVYDLPKTPPKKRPGQQEKEFFDAAYFSGCISLLPDPPAALDAVSSLVKPGGYIYITQTYQRTNVPLLKYFKPLMKYFLSIDFGELVMVEEVEDKLWKGCSSNLKVLEHKVIPGSVDNMFQAAYLTVMKKED